MLTHVVFSFLFLLKLSVVKSEHSIIKCRNDYRHMNNTQIDVTKFCSSNTCIEKCCGEGEMFAPRGHCTNTVEMFQRFKKVSKLISDVDYSKIVLFSWDGSVKNKSKKGFVFIKNQRNIEHCTARHLITNDFIILEDGAVMMQDEYSNEWESWRNIEGLEYCIDFILTVFNKTPQVKLLFRENTVNPEEETRGYRYFVLIVMLVSSFFLLVVLVVYCLLPELQNLMGLVLIAYTLSSLVTTLANVVVALSDKSLTTYQCKIITPIMYFMEVSSVFWMNVISFDVWWLLRGHRKRCDINRRDERVKFMWYCLYAWGIPLLMTAVFTTMDYIDLSSLHINKPNIDDCLFFLIGVRLYYDIPIGVIISVNFIFFSLTVYNIWMTKRAVNKCQDSRSSAQGTSRFVTFMKLFVVMGLSLFLDFIPMDALWVYLLITTYNRLSGVFLFFLFVFNKKIFFKLCKRFNININILQTKSNLGNGTSRTSPPVATKDQTHEMDQFENRPKVENIID